MSDFSESQRRSWNNDFMDPDWKPTFDPDNSPLGKISRLLDAFMWISGAFLKLTDEDLSLDENKYSIKITISLRQAKEIRRAIMEYNTENHKNKGES